MKKCIKIINKDGSLKIKTKGGEVDVRNWADVFVTDRITQLGDTVEIHLSK